MKGYVCIVCTLIIALCMASCSPKNKVVPLSCEGRLAVAGFFQPAHSWEFMGNYLQEDLETLPPEAFGFMNNELAVLLAKRKDASPCVGPGIVRQCQEILLAKQNRSQASASAFWMDVARCVSADYLLVPYLFEWQEREGNDWSIKKPASLTFDLYLIDVKNESVKRAHYEERQHSLSENMLDAGTFFKRKGKWITVEEMAREGLAQCLKELGL